MNELNLSAPWHLYIEKIEALLCQDNQISFNYDDNEKKFTINVTNAIKADALRKLLPTHKSFTSVNLTIDVVSVNDAASKADLIAAALSGNPLFSRVVTSESYPCMEVTHVMFEPEVIRYYSDDIMDLYGNTNTLAQDLAEEIFGSETGLNYGTEL